MTEQLQADMAKMMGEEKTAATYLGDMFKQLNVVKNMKYGFKEDDHVTVPLKPSIEGVKILEMKRDTERDDIQKNLKRVKQLLMKIHTDINNTQKTTYRFLMTKKRQRDYSDKEENHKRKRKEEAMTSRVRQTDMLSTNTTLDDLVNEMNNEDADDEEFDFS